MLLITPPLPLRTLLGGFAICALMTACGGDDMPDSDTADATSTGNDTATDETSGDGDGDGDETTGDGDGDGTTGDGDGTTGDGDGDGTTGDGDGDGALDAMTYTVDGVVHDVINLGCTGSGAPAINQFSPRHQLNVAIGGGLAVGTFPVSVDAFAPPDGEAGLGLVTGDVVTEMYVSLPGGSVTVTDDGGSFNFQFSGIPMLHTMSTTEKIVAGNFTCD